MPYTTSYVDDGKGLLKTGSGVVTGLELISGALAQSLDDERNRKIRYALVDFSTTVEMKATPTDIRRMVEMNRRTAAMSPNAIVAIIAPAPLPYALARLWHTFSGDLGWKANVFHARPDAVAWLRKELSFQEGASATLEEFPFLQTAG